jgi:hypothetical protein
MYVVFLVWLGFGLSEELTVPVSADLFVLNILNILFCFIARFGSAASHPLCPSPLLTPSDDDDTSPAGTYETTSLCSVQRPESHRKISSLSLSLSPSLSLRLPFFHLLLADNARVPHPIVVSHIQSGLGEMAEARSRTQRMRSPTTGKRSGCQCQGHSRKAGPPDCPCSPPDFSEFLRRTAGDIGGGGVPAGLGM